MRPVDWIENSSGEHISPCIEPTHGGYRVTKSDLYSESTGRSSETGAMLSYPIRLGIVTIELEYIGTAAEIAQIQGLFEGRTEVRVRFLDGTNYTTKKFYPSDRQLDCESLADSGKVSLLFSLIEI